jgi:hypothetical protein
MWRAATDIDDHATVGRAKQQPSEIENNSTSGGVSGAGIGMRNARHGAGVFRTTIQS